MGNGEKRFAIPAVILLALALFAGARQDPPANPNASATDPAWVDLMTSMERMHAAVAAVRRSGETDSNFVRLMLPHHQAAIDMAKAQLQYGKDPQMRRLAEEIITDQQSEIELMQLWLKQHGYESKKADRGLRLSVSREK